MKTLVGAAVLVILSGRGGLAPPQRVPVLVELFTSEGCSTCPEADALLESLQRDQPIDGAEIIPIALHVDYFNHDGWRDPFSSAAYTARQEGYSPVLGPDNVYTPQIVVDGREALAGNDGKIARRAIGSAVGRPHLPVRLTAQSTPDKVRMTIDLPAAPASGEKIQLMAAITQNGLSMNVKGGENNGRTLHHMAVVRTLQALDSLTGAGSVVDKQLALGRAWGPNGLNAVVWLQGVKSRQVYGAAVAPIAR